MRSKEKENNESHWNQFCCLILLSSTGFAYYNKFCCFSISLLYLVWCCFFFLSFLRQHIWYTWPSDTHIIQTVHITHIIRGPAIPTSQNIPTVWHREKERKNLLIFSDFFYILVVVVIVIFCIKFLCLCCHTNTHHGLTNVQSVSWSRCLYACALFIHM